MDGRKTLELNMNTRKIYIIDGLTLYWAVAYPNNEIYKAGIARVFRERDELFHDIQMQKLHMDFDVYWEPEQFGVEPQ